MKFFNKYRSGLYRFYWLFLITVLIVPSIYLFYAYYKQFHTRGYSMIPNDWTNFGSYASAIVGMLLTPISTILIYLTYKNQLATSNLQQFESTFFSLLQNQREILKALKGNPFESEFIVSDFSYEADEYVDVVANQIDSYFDNFHNYKVNTKSRDEVLELNIVDTKKKVDGIYQYIFLETSKELGHYFRHLYHIVKYVHESSNKNKKKYTDIVQAQMSDNELYITMYNRMSRHGIEKFKPLLDKYDFFDNVTSRGLIFDKHKKIFFPSINFKSNTDPNPPSIPLSEI